MTLPREINALNSFINPFIDSSSSGLYQFKVSVSTGVLHVPA
jgi:hypothetical protein